MTRSKQSLLLQPKVTGTETGAHQKTRSQRLPEDFVSEQIQRLAVCAAIGAGLWVYGLVMDTMVTPITASTPITAVGVVTEILAIAASILLFFYVRSGSHASRVKVHAGLAYFVLNAAGVAVLNTWVRTPSVAGIGRLSWNTVVILIASMILPASPRQMLGASIVAASLDPLGVWIAHLRGVAVPSLMNTLVLFMPNYACAIVATLPAHVLQRLGRRLRQAQEMGSYHLVELLGRGGMGEVWRGRHRLLARDAAIKLVRPELLGVSTDAEARSMLRRFELEAQATAALSSPHTIRLFDFGITADQTFYYVMELLTGRDLDSLVREFGPIPYDRTLYVLRQMCHSLADAHARGMVHRDVTPANVYICRMGLEYDFVKVLDFGLVKFNDTSSMRTTLMSGDVRTSGTPAFMAPETILNDGTVDQRADVYAVGCVAYYLLTGQPVFDADTTMKMFVQHLHETPIPPSQRTEMPIPPQVDALVMACLEKDPARRPQNAEQLLEMVRRCQPRETWDNGAARKWWEEHLPVLTGPLTANPAVDEAERSLVMQ